MKLKIMILMCLLSIGGCKSVKVDEPLSLVKFIDHEINKGRVGKNPLLVQNGKPIGKLSSIDPSAALFSKPVSRPSSFNKEMPAMIKIFGDEAKDGIISFEDRLLLYCKRPPPLLYLLNGREIHINELFEQIKNKKILHYSEMNWVQREQDTAYIYSHIYSYITK